MSGACGKINGVITCVVRYEIVPSKIVDFEQFASRWIALVNASGGTHHGYFLPSEGASDIAYALFSFPSFAAYEQYRKKFGVDPEFIAADKIRDDSGCVVRYERSFFRPLLSQHNGRPEGWHTVTPRLVVHDPAKLVHFLVDAFGAIGEYRSDAPSVMRIGDSTIMISGAGPRKPTPGFLYLYVDDVDATYRRALEAGAVALEAPEQTPYGDRRAMVTDPFDNDWQIATYNVNGFVE